MFKRKNLFLIVATLALFLALTTAALAGDNGTNYVHFNGTSDYIDLGSTPIIGSDTSFTIEVWVKPDNFGFSAGEQNAIYGEFAVNHTSNYFGIFENGTVFFDQYPESYQYITSNTALTLGEWSHIAYVQDGMNRYLYINGQLDISDSAAETYTGNPPNQVLIGDRPSYFEEYFAGDMDEFRIWNVARTATEINETMFSPISPGLETELVVYYSFDTAFSGPPNFTVWDDSNGTQYDGTNNGTGQYGPSSAPLWDKQQYSHQNMAGIWDSNTSGTSDGMTVIDNTFLVETGDDIIFGQTYADPNTNDDVPTTGDWVGAPNPARWTQVWYCDVFDASGSPPCRNC